MGIVETSLRKMIRVGEMMDVTLIGGRELRGRLTAIGEDGIFLMENGYERPIAFAGMATYAPMRTMPQARNEEKISAGRPAEEEPVQAAGPEETVSQEEGWIERYEGGAGVGSIACGGAHVLFKADDVLDQRLADQLGNWFGRPIAVQFTLHSKGALKNATCITERCAQDKDQPTGPAAEQRGTRYGFGEILHYDKRGGYGKAREGDVKFLFRREDIISDALWKEIIQSPNTCGIKIAFTVQDGKHAQLRELRALQTPDEVTAPDFDAVPAEEPEEDVNPIARVTFTDGTTMEEAVHAGYVIFYNADKSFGRLQQDSGDRYYFRAGDVMQKSLLEHLNGNPEVADTAVTFSVKRLPTGKLAAGRVCWQTLSAASKKAAQPQAEEPVQPASAAPEAEKATPPAKRAEALQLNAYLENYMRLAGATVEELDGRLRAAAENCGDDAVRRDILLEIVALSDVRREKRDDAMLRYLRAVVREGGGEQLNGFLSIASYSGTEMFDALTALFAVSEGACGRLCGLVVADRELVTLRGEILSRFGSVPETAASLKECWRPLIEQERAATAYARMLPSAQALSAIDPEGKHASWAQTLGDAQALEAGEKVDAQAMSERLRAQMEEILRLPSRPAVEWLLPIVEKAQMRLSGGAQGAELTLRALCAVTVGGVRYGCVEILGSGKEVRVQLGEARIELGDLSGCAQAALPCRERSAQVRLAAQGVQQETELIFDDAPARGDWECIVQKMKAEGLAVLCGPGEERLSQIEAELKEDVDCALMRGSTAQSVGQAIRGLLETLEEALRERFGAQVAGLMAFPPRAQAGQMDEEALTGALMGVLRDFADVKLLNDELKAAYIACLIDAGAQSGPLYALAAKMKELGVRCALAVKEKPDGVPEEQAVRLPEETVEAALSAAGCAVRGLRVYKEETSDEIG